MSNTSGTAEVRPLTVLFCDLVGSTALSELLVNDEDGEDYNEVTGRYRAVCVAAINRHDGYVAQILGDGVLAYFGFPIAHEDDARRGIRAALEIVEGLKELSPWVHKEYGVAALRARLGIHTGPVVVSEVESGERRELLALGKTSNLASRIKDVADPDDVLVTHDTFKIVPGFFEFSPLGAHELKGFSETTLLYRILRESGAQSRIDVQRRSGLTPLTGRDEELAILEGHWNAASTGNSHTVLVRGEAGIGKSRIVDALRVRIADHQSAILECFCTTYARNEPLFPIVEQVERVLGFTRETTNAEKRAVLDRRLGLRGILTEETSALMAELLSIPLSEENPILSYSPQKRRERTLETLLEWFLASAADGPTLWVVEDLQWMDPTSLEFVSSVLASSSTLPLLVILTFRPEFVAPWPIGGRLSSMDLTRLADELGASMAVRVAHGKAIPGEVLGRIVELSNGIPLYVEEITKSVLDLGVLIEREDHFEITGPLPANLIPPSMHGSLTARLDRFGSAKILAQIAAAIGREFSYALLSVVADQPDIELRRSLDVLLGTELVNRNEDSPEETYLFKHALLQDAACASRPKRSLRSLHKRIAEALTNRFPEIAEHNPERVAHHYNEAGHADQAVIFWWRAGHLAVVRAANHEAITHLRRGLEKVNKLPASHQFEQELELLVTLIPALIAAEGWASVELERVYRRAAELVDLLGNTPYRFKVLAGTMGYHFVAGRVAQSLELARELLALASAIDDPELGPRLVTMGRQDCSAAHCYHGDFRLAIEHAEAGLAEQILDNELILARELGLSPCVGMLAYQNIAFWMLGRPQRSKEAGERCLALALELGHPPSIGFALTGRTASCYLQGDAEATLACAEEALRLTREERLGFWEPMIAVFQGWAIAELSDRAKGIGLIREAIKRYYATGNGLEQVWFHAILAQAEWKAGESRNAFNTLAQAMTLARINGEGLFEPELYRLEGEFLFAQARFAEAEQRIRESLDMACCQEAKMLELRSLVSLCRVLRESGDIAPARDMLWETYQSLPEEFETPDRREAQAMLATLKN
jgi:class 3 adenylate cyclase/tetratricopeptide (TPR) repeat protein